MFNDLDATLKALLQDDDEAVGDAPAVDANQVLVPHRHVSFETPDDTFAGKVGEGTINLFLFEVSENRDLRNLLPERSLLPPDTSLPENDRKPGRYTFALPPLRVSCRYLVSAWSPASGEKKILEEHQLLGWALQRLSSFAEIPTGYLKGDLQQTLSEPLPPTLVAQLDGGRPTDFWQALKVSPRVAFELVVTISMPRLGDATAAPIAASGVIRMGLRTPPDDSGAFAETIRPNTET